MGTPRLTLPRAYLRMSPNLDQHPDPEGMVLLLCAANRQPQRGRFRDKATLSRALGTARLKRFLDRGDVVQVVGGWYVEGWDEWQEGDLTVGERQARIRDRRRDSAVIQPLSSRDSVTAGDDLQPLSSRDNAVTRPSLDRAAPSEAIGVRRTSSHEEVDEGSTRPSTSQDAGANGRVVDPIDEEAVPWLA